MPIFGLIIQAAILAGALYLVGRHEAEFNFWRLVLVAFGIALIGWVVSLTVMFTLGDKEGYVSLWIYLPILWTTMLTTGAFLIQRFLYLRWPHAFAAAAIYLVTSSIVDLLFDQVAM